VRTAPPVSVRCSGGVAWRALRVGLPALAAGALAAGVLGHVGAAAVLALAVMAVAALVAWPLTRTLPVALAWDGQRWTADGVPGALDVMIDLGAGLLLRLRPTERRTAPRWMAVTASEAGAAMHALRAAAYAHAPGTASKPDAGPDGLRLPR
jgi:hypothetical protein